MNASAKIWLSITVASVLSSAILVGLLILVVNKQVILGLEWDNDGPSNFAFFFRYFLPALVSAFLLFAFAFIKSLSTLTKPYKLLIKVGVVLIATTPVLTFWLLQQGGIVKWAEFNSTKELVQPLDSGPANAN